MQRIATQTPSTFLVGLILLASLVRIDWCTAELPPKLHVSSVVYSFVHNDLTSIQVPQRITTFSEYQVDEYVDLETNRSSVLLYNINLNTRDIYYSQLAPNRESGERKLVAYNVESSRCEARSEADWHLVLVHKTSLDVNANADDASQMRTDVAIGPSGLLYAIESNLYDFRYRGTTFSKSRLTEVEVYGNTFVHYTTYGHEYVTLIVHVINRTNKKLELNEPMSKLHEDPGESRKVSVVMAGACRAMSDMEKKETNFSYDRTKRVKAELQLEEDNFCERYQTLFVIHYGLVEAYKPGSLIGKSLEDYGDDPYDFHREPFLLPTGIGCWSSLQSDPSWEMSLTRGNPIVEASGEYVSSIGVSRLSYFAYDRERGLFRLDRNGRKSVYDLWRLKSYHVGEFSAPHEIVAPELRKEPMPGYGDTLQRCLALDISFTSQVVPQNGDVIKQVLGLKGGSGDEHYLGSRVIDHVNYEVFEKELDRYEAVPVVLHMTKLRLSKELQSKRFFITYYAQNGAEPWRPFAEKKLLLLSYVELWEFDVQRINKRLLNRIQFTEFSWHLDVEPGNDPSSQHFDQISMRLFQMEPCYDERMGQMELVTEFTRLDSVRLDDQLLRNLRAHRHLIGSRIHRLMADSLRISRLNLIDMRLKVLDSGDLLTTARAADLHLGMADIQLLGHINNVDKYIQAIFHNRHTLEECLMESAASLSPNWLVFCPQQSLCILIDQDDGIKRYLQPGQESPHNKDEPDMCQVYSFKYSIKPNLMGRRALEPSDAIFWAHSRRTIEIDFDEDQGKVRAQNETSAYEAVAHIREIKELDTIGSRLRNDAALLSGIRYTTTSEEPGARNFNVRVPVPKQTRMGSFRYCQLACQMDDLCGSFSICQRNGKPNKAGDTDDDCVLAAVHLNAERINQIIAAPHMAAKRLETFEVKVTSETHSQVLMMRNDESCSLHPRDFLADFEVTDSFIKRGSGEQNNSSFQLDKRYLSLEECASLGFQHNLDVDWRLTNFTYCPLDSNCIMAGDEASKKLGSLAGYCYRYDRLSTWPYERKDLAYMVLVPRIGASIKEDEAPEMEEKDPIEEAKRMEEGQLVRKFWASSEQVCARECNLHMSRCLAFNSCRQDGKVLCMLLSVRSVMTRSSAYLPELEMERASVKEHNPVIFSNLICRHFYLKPDYFEVRLNHLLMHEKSGKPPGGWKYDSNEDRDELVNQLERRIVQEDIGKSNEQLEQYLKDSKNYAAYGPETMNQNRWINFSALMFGLLLGVVATMYREHIFTGYIWLRDRRLRRDSLQTNRLVLDDPFAAS